MTEPVTSAVLMGQGKRYSAKGITLWKKIPPTQDALLQHTHRALYQAGSWTTCTQTQPEIPSPEKFGWTMESGRWVPVWITLPEVSKACSQAH